MSGSKAKLPPVPREHKHQTMLLNDRFRKMVNEMMTKFEMTQAQVAALIGCSREHISNVMNDHKDVSQALVKSMEAHLQIMRKFGPKQARKNALVSAIEGVIAEFEPDQQAPALKEILRFAGTLKSFSAPRSR